MKITEILKNKMSFSLEVFPPKEDKPMAPLLETLDKLSSFQPDFISCTYGAGGTDKGRSLEVCQAIVSGGNEAMTHLTCIGNTRENLREEIQEYRKLGIENILALRGDLPTGWTGTQGDFSYADQLVAFIKEHFPQVCIAAACYPETHLYAVSPEADIAHLRVKQDCGTDVLVTQLCHDIEAYIDFREKIIKAGVHLPVLFGLMPVLSKDSIVKMALVTGCSIPRELSALIGKYGDKPEEFKKAGKEFTVNQIYKIISAGVDGLHIYVLNKHADVSDILLASGIRNGVLSVAGTHA